jgi:hypothetical protein
MTGALDKITNNLGEAITNMSGALNNITESISVAITGLEVENIERMERNTKGLIDDILINLNQVLAELSPEVNECSY